MINVLIIIAIVMLAAVLAMLVAVMGKVGRLNAANTDQTVRDEMQRVRQEMENHSRGLRQEVGQQQDRANQMLVGTLHKLGEDQRGVLKDITTQNIEALDRMRIAVENKFAQIQESNEKKLDEMRRTVDEKLQTTLEKRLGESFKLVSERLEAVQRGLGEMQTLASDVGGLKRVLTNVKDRGTWGEYQLGAILSEILTPDQYAQNVSPKNNSDRVEYAVRLPGRAEDGGDPVWLPIDAKFPKEDYERLLDAVQAADMDGVKK
ncbi:MAG TPA: DNA recombination protein RmuC, partial [Myxococcota bacterium]|nr:DNA recombination protein RmuC [Myxococcota bacterium]